MGVRSTKSITPSDAGRPIQHLAAILGFAGSLLSGTVFVHFIVEELILQHERVFRQSAIAISALGAVFVLGAASAYLAKFVKSFPSVLGTRRVFLSYPSELAEVASQVAGALRESGKRVWVDREQRFGENIKVAIDKAISDSDVVVVLLSNRSSQYVNWEVESALKKGIKIVPVTTGDSVKVPDGLRSFPTIRLGSDLPRGINWIVQAV